MKTKFTLALIAVLSVTSLALVSFRTASKSTTDDTYDVQFISTQQVGSNYEWVWTVTNPNPGNGSNGTLQNLSHWSLAISDLVTYDDLVQVAYSNDGTNWTTMPLSFAIDKSQDCYAGVVLKFDHGTTGSAPTYYKLVVNKEFTSGPTLANFKSGSRTGCFNATVNGIGVPTTPGGNDR